MIWRGEVAHMRAPEPEHEACWVAADRPTVIWLRGPQIWIARWCWRRTASRPAMQLDSPSTAEPCCWQSTYSKASGAVGEERHCCRRT